MRIVMCLIALASVGCKVASQGKPETSNPELVVDYLGTFEDCRIYRFIDGHTVHFVRCGQERVTTIGRYQSGKVTRSYNVDVNP